MSDFLKFPFYAKAALLLVGMYLTVNILSITAGIVIPLVFALLFAILLGPMVKFLVKKKLSRIVSVSIVVFTTMILLTTAIALLSTQLSVFGEALPQLFDKFNVLIDNSVNKLSGIFNVSSKKIQDSISNFRTELAGKSSTMIGNTLGVVGGFLSAAILTPVYVFMMLYYQPHLVKFLHQLFGEKNGENVSEVLVETKSIIQSYLHGLFIEMLIIAVLNSIGLFILGMEYAIVLGIMGALLNVIPYLGALIAMTIYMLIAFMTKTPVHMLYVMIMYAVIQLIDNNFLVPNIVGSKVKLNALTSLLAVIAGAAMWGIPGMFLSIPLIAIVKLILDRIDAVKPWGFLLGAPETPVAKMKVNLTDLKKQAMHIAKLKGRKNDPKE